MSKPAPPGWNKTIDDLFEEMKKGKRLFATGDEATGREITSGRSYLPARYSREAGRFGRRFTTAMCMWATSSQHQPVLAAQAGLPLERGFASARAASIRSPSSPASRHFDTMSCTRA